MTHDVLAVIGGSGIYELDALAQMERLVVDTPFGAPSDSIVRGMLGPTTMLSFCPATDRGIALLPHEIPYRANICAMKKLGATHLVSVSAVGSMQEDIAPGEFVIADQFIDLTKRRVSTFFEDGIVGHVGFADPVCPLMASALAEAAERAGARVHRKGTYVCIEGPQFSTRAESLLYRSWGASVIGMTAMPEAKLAREAELPYAVMALATDYDCWHASEEDVNVEAVVKVMKKNAATARQVVAELAGHLPDRSKSAATSALMGAIMTARDRIQPAAWARLEWLGKNLRG